MVNYTKNLIVTFQQKAPKATITITLHFQKNGKTT